MRWRLLAAVLLHAMRAMAGKAMWQVLADDPTFAMTTNYTARYPELVSILNSTDVLYTLFAIAAITVDTLGQASPERIKQWQEFVYKATPPFNTSVRGLSTGERNPLHTQPHSCLKQSWKAPDITL